jgi:hypothetical protein
MDASIKNLICCIVLVASPALSLAQSLQQAWERMQQQIRKNAGVIAYEISFRFELWGDSESEAGQYSTRVLQLDSKGVPQRELVLAGNDSKAAYKMDALSLTLAVHAANRPEEFLSSPWSIVFVVNENIDGELASVYEVKARVGKGNFPVLAKVWIGQKNGAPIKIEGTLEKLPLPGVKSAAFVLRYASGDNGLTLPSALQIKDSISLLFHTGQVSFQQKLMDWRPL